jgi:DNA-binding LytR/AlgR family response regulator
MTYSYIIIDEANKSEKTVELLAEYQDFLCLSVCDNRQTGVNKILELKPNIVFLVYNGNSDQDIQLFLSILGELNEYLNTLPHIIVISKDKEVAYNCFQRGVDGFLLNPVNNDDLRRCLFRYTKNNQEAGAEKICIKTQGDYHFLKAANIVYLKADNNTTDFYLSNGKVISGFKTLKYYEQLLPFYFLRIHHSYLINIEYVSRINIGKSNCFLNNNEIILPFSRTYKDNINTIINRIS